MAEEQKVASIPVLERTRSSLEGRKKSGKKL
jgi:hypothetical protein